MNSSIIHLDGKHRLSIPIGYRSIFSPKNIVYGSSRTHSLLIGASPYWGISPYEDEMDDTGRIVIGKDLVKILGVGEQDSNRTQVMWIPYQTKDKMEFLLFFGAIGQETWEKILATKTAVNRLVLG